MKAAVSALALLLAVTPVDALAQTYSTDFFDVGPLREGGGCWLGGDWSLPGRPAVNLEISIETGGDVFVAVWSDGWSRPSVDLRKALGVIFWGADGEKQTFVMVGLPMGSPGNYRERPGLITILPEEKRDEFLSAFAASRSVTVLTRDLDAVEGTDFDTILEGGLQGSSLALTRLRSCTTDIQRREADQAAREASVAHIDRDPFSAVVPAEGTGEPRWTTPPVPDFPERAASQGISEGEVVLGCLIGSGGSVFGCAIVSETPQGSGFGAAALSAARRARLDPAFVQDRRPAERFEFTIRFTNPS